MVELVGNRPATPGRIVICGTSACARALMNVIEYGPPAGPLTDTLPLSAAIWFRLFSSEPVAPVPPVAGRPVPLVCVAHVAPARSCCGSGLFTPPWLGNGLTFWPVF